VQPALQHVNTWLFLHMRSNHVLAAAAAAAAVAAACTGHAGMVLSKPAFDQPPKMHMTVFQSKEDVPTDFELFPNGEPADLAAAGKDNYQMSLTKGGSSHTAAATVPDATNEEKEGDHEGP
jgi:hypothetical protein